MSSQAIVHIVDDDEAVRQALGLLMETVGLETRTYASANEFLDLFDNTGPGCLVLDVRMPEMSGLDLQHELSRRHIEVPIIIITGHGDVPLAVRAMKAGAMDVIEKPFNDQVLIDTIVRAIDESAKIIKRQDTRSVFLECFNNLSQREREVMELLITGMVSKEIASILGISSKTVDVHRAHILEKMQAGSIVELVHAWNENRPDMDGRDQRF